MLKHVGIQTPVQGFIHYLFIFVRCGAFRSSTQHMVAVPLQKSPPGFYFLKILKSFTLN